MGCYWTFSSGSPSESACQPLLICAAQCLPPISADPTVSRKPQTISEGSPGTTQGDPTQSKLGFPCPWEFLKDMVICGFLQCPGGNREQGKVQITQVCALKSCPGQEVPLCTIFHILPTALAPLSGLNRKHIDHGVQSFSSACHLVPSFARRLYPRDCSFCDRSVTQTGSGKVQVH